MRLFVIGIIPEEVDLPLVRSLGGKREKPQQHRAMPMPSVRCHEYCTQSQWLRIPCAPLIRFYRTRWIVSMIPGLLATMPLLWSMITVVPIRFLKISINSYGIIYIFRMSTLTPPSSSWPEYLKSA
jgi:hypothetical protein